MTVEERALYEIGIKDAFTSGLRKMEGAMNQFEGKLGGLKTTIAGVFTGNLLADAVTNVTRFFVDTGLKAINLAKDMEQTNIAFSTLLGSADLAKKTIGELRHFADITPFDTTEVIGYGKSLLSFQFTTKELIPTLTKLGDVAAGMNIPLGDMVNIFGRMKSGPIQMEQMNRFIERGVPIMNELSKMTGKNETELRKMISKREINFKMIDEAFNRMTAAGSKFGRMMDAQSKSFGGRLSTFQSKIDNIMTDWGMRLLPTVGKWLDKISEYIDAILGADWSGFMATWDQLWQMVGEVFGIMGELFTMMFGNMTTVEKMTAAVNMLALSFRIASTPVRMLISAVEILFTIIKYGAPILDYFLSAMDAMVNYDYGGAVANLALMKNAYENYTAAVEYESNRIRGRERKGWEDIMGGKKDEEDPYGLKKTTGGAAVGAGGGLTGTGAATDASKGAGVEKIHAGTRNITIHIQTIKLADNLVSNKADLSDVRVQEMMQRALLTAVNDVNIMGH